MRAITLTTVMAVACGALAEAALADCPVDTSRIHYQQMVTSAAVLDSSLINTIDPVRPADPDTERVVYDLTRAWLMVYASSAPTLTGAFTRVSDIYTLETEVPAPIPLSLDLEVHEESAFGNVSHRAVGVFCGASSEAGQSVGDYDMFNGDPIAHPPFVRDLSLSLPLIVTPGVPFRLRFELGFDGSVSGLAGPVLQTMSFRFGGMPDGARMTSCQGLVQEGDAVPASTETWGRIKARYR